MKLEQKVKAAEWIDESWKGQRYDRLLDAASAVFDDISHDDLMKFWEAIGELVSPQSHQSYASASVNLAGICKELFGESALHNAYELEEMQLEHQQYIAELDMNRRNHDLTER